MVGGFGRIQNYIALKPRRLNNLQCVSFGRIQNYIALKLFFQMFFKIISFGRIQNYIALKPRRRFFVPQNSVIAPFIYSKNRF